MITKVIAYIPVLNQRHLDWLREKKPTAIWLVSNQMAGELLPRLSRNMSAVPTKDMLIMLRALGVSDLVHEFQPDLEFLSLGSDREGWLLPDEDISHVVHEKYLKPADIKAKFEKIWARWDMSAVTAEQPVVPDLLVSEEYFDKTRMLLAQSFSQESPDWWRQVGALITNVDGHPLSMAFNKHMPNEYVTYTFGDPRLYANAGEKGKSCAMHAERGAIAECARVGIATEGTSIYVTTFPCEDCAREIVAAGIKKVFFRDGYSVLNAMEVLREGRVAIVQVRV